MSSSIIGVAPKAKLLAYKVFGSTGYSNEEMVIEAFLMAYESGVSGETLVISLFTGR